MTSDERFMVEHDLPLLERMCGMLRTSVEWAKQKPEVTTGYFRTPIIFGNEFPVNFTLNIPAKASNYSQNQSIYFASNSKWPKFGKPTNPTWNYIYNA